MNRKVLFLPFFLFSIFFVFSARGQNLVPNGSFEEYSFCPSTLDALHDNCLYWFKSIQVPGAEMWENPSPDYFHGCAGSNPFTFGTPDNIMGHQEAHSGEAYAGIITYAQGQPNYREIIGIHLQQPLIIGEEYLVNFYVCRAGELINLRASNNIGLKFTNSAVFSSSESVINNTAHFHVDSIITDADNWLEISYVFIADSTYDFLHIGNFYDDQNTNEFPISSQNNTYAYYFIDDVSIERITSTHTLNTSNFIIYPTPCHDFLTVRQKSPWMFRYEIFSVTGRLVIQNKLEFKVENTIPTEKLEKGLYTLIVYDRNGISLCKTFIKL